MPKIATSCLIAWGLLGMLGGCWGISASPDKAGSGVFAIVGAVVFAAGMIRDAIEAARRP
jgi:hypothetical protein